MTALGIEAINAYLGRACVDVAALFAARELSPARLDNLRMHRRSVNLPCEDAVSNAVNAAKPLLDALSADERDRIEAVVVATESGVDLGKPLSTYVHHHLGLGPRCRSFEVKHACYGGTAALQAAVGMVAVGPPGAKALVIATDAPGEAAVGTYWEPAEGAGAVAMLVGDAPAVLTVDLGASGYHTFEVMDTARPRADLDLVDSDLSLLSYISCLQNAVGAYLDRVAGADLMSSFDHLAFHTPFAGMVKGAHRALLRHHGIAAADVVDGDFARRVEASLVYPAQVGNLFSASLYLALCSLLDHADLDGHGARVGLFSYGSGCGSEFFSGVVTDRSSARLAERDLGSGLADRYPLDVAEYEALSALGTQRSFGVRTAVLDTTPYRSLFDAVFAGSGLLVLSAIDEFHRAYRWA